MTLAELNRFIIAGLTTPLGAREAAATARLLLEDGLQVTPVKLLTSPDRVIEPATEQMFRRYVARIAAGEPPQYVVGRAHWMGLDLEVSPAVLIPRPETAELVDIITDRAAGRSDLSVLDVGTGSGCIAIALARALPFSRVTAVDISADALAVARANADRLHASIDFRRLDILHASADDLGGRFDIIVSNPPYIAESEKSDMEPRVYEHEPQQALFVPDSDPLRFYTAIARLARQALNPGGTLYFEINPLFATQLQSMLLSQGFESELRRDSQGRRRFAIATVND